jgi:hypothetical protein
MGADVRRIASENLANAVHLGIPESWPVHRDGPQHAERVPGGVRDARSVRKGVPLGAIVPGATAKRVAAGGKRWIVPEQDEGNNTGGERAMASPS